MMTKFRTAAVMAVMSVSALMLTACQTADPLVAKPYENNAQIQRAWNRLDATDIAVETVRVAKTMDMDCAGDMIPIDGEGNYRNKNEAFAAYWKKAFEMDLAATGRLNEAKPKVKIYNLIESVKIQAEPTSLRWMIEMHLFSSNGTMMNQSIEYNAPTDDLKNMREGCRRLSDSLDKAVSWSIVKTISDPHFEALVRPGLGYEPSMKLESLTTSLKSIVKPEDESEVWKNKPNGR